MIKKDYLTCNKLTILRKLVYFWLGNRETFFSFIFNKKSDEIYIKFDDKKIQKEFEQWLKA